MSLDRREVILRDSGADSKKESERAKKKWAKKIVRPFRLFLAPRVFKDGVRSVTSKKW